MTERLMYFHAPSAHGGDVAAKPRDTSSDTRAFDVRAVEAPERGSEDELVVTGWPADRLEVLPAFADHEPPTLAATQVTLGRATAVLVEPLRTARDDVPPSLDATTVRLGPPDAYPKRRGSVKAARRRARLWQAAGIGAVALVVTGGALALRATDGSARQSASMLTAPTPASTGEATEADVRAEGPDGQSGPVPQQRADATTAAAARRAAAGLPATDFVVRLAQQNARLSSCAAFAGRAPELAAGRTMVAAIPDPARGATLRLQPVDGWSTLTTGQPWRALDVLRGWGTGRHVTVRLVGLPVTTALKAMSGSTDGASWTAPALPAEAEVLRTVSVTLVAGTAGCPAN